MRILNQTRNTVLAQDAILANTIISGMVGLLKHKSLAAGEGMLITPAHSIHMFFMKFAIDAIFINRKNMVVGLVKNIRPFQMSPYFWCATAVIELPSGTIELTQTRLGDQINY